MRVRHPLTKIHTQGPHVFLQAGLPPAPDTHRNAPHAHTRVRDCHSISATQSHEVTQTQKYTKTQRCTQAPMSTQLLLTQADMQCHRDVYVRCPGAHRPPSPPDSYILSPPNSCATWHHAPAWETHTSTRLQPLCDLHKANARPFHKGCLAPPTSESGGTARGARGDTRPACSVSPRGRHSTQLCS